VSNGGDEIRVAPGEYGENIVWPDAYDVKLMCMGGECTVEAEEAGEPVIRGDFTDAMRLTIQGMTLTGGSDGIFLDFGVAATPEEVKIAGNTIHGNTNHGIRLEAEHTQTVEISENEIYGNDVGIEVRKVDAFVTSNKVRDNGTQGIMLYGRSDRKARVNGNEVYGNGRDAVEATYGIGITSSGSEYFSEIECTGNEVYGNDTDYGVWVESDNGTMTVTHNRIYGHGDAHTVAALSVRKILLESNFQIEVRNNRIFGNTHAVGMELVDEGTDPVSLEALNNLVYGNRVGFHLTRAEQTTAGVVNNTVAYNSESGFVLEGDYRGTVALENMILWGNADDLDVADTRNYTIGYSDVGEQGGSDPLFVDVDGVDNVPGNEDDDYRLQEGLPGSPCIDAGNEDEAHNDPDGSRNDMGYTGGPGGVNTYAAGVAVPLAYDGKELGTVTFSGLSQPGHTWGYRGRSFEGVPEGYRLGEWEGHEVFVELETDAEYTGSILVCLKYMEGYFAEVEGFEEGNLKLFHKQGEEFVDITLPHEEDPVDEENNIVCGETTELSPFAIVYPLCADEDGDGYGDPASEGCPHPQEDCDDTDPAVHPGATEGPPGDATCGDGKDNDCDLAVDTDDGGCVNGSCTASAAASVAADDPAEGRDTGSWLQYLFFALGMVGLLLRVLRWRRPSIR
jgi:hypothetical protein